MRQKPQIWFFLLIQSSVIPWLRIKHAKRLLLVLVIAHCFLEPLPLALYVSKLVPRKWGDSWCLPFRPWFKGTTRRHKHTLADEGWTVPVNCGYPFDARYTGVDFFGRLVFCYYLILVAVFKGTRRGTPPLSFFFSFFWGGSRKKDILKTGLRPPPKRRAA